MLDPPLSDIYLKNKMVWVWTTLKIERVSHSKKMFFVIGLSETDLANEIKLHDDIIIGDFEDTYENLAFKTLLGYQFSIHYCPSGLVFENFYEILVVRFCSRPARSKSEQLKNLE